MVTAEQRLSQSARHFRQRFSNNPQQCIDREWFGKESETFGGDEPLNEIRIMETGDKENLQVRLVAPEPFRHYRTSQIRHNHIGQQ